MLHICVDDIIIVIEVPSFSFIVMIMAIGTFVFAEPPGVNFGA